MALHRRAANHSRSGNEPSSSGSGRFLVPKKTLRQKAEFYLPILRWLPNYNVSRDLKFDIVAGITVSMMLIPQEVSLSNIMNVPAHHGLYTAATAPLVYALFGSSTVLSVASGSEVSLLVGTILSDIEDKDERVATGIMLAFLSGCILLLVRFFQLSPIADFFSRPVMGGFVSAGGLLIMLSQVASWLAITVTHTSHPPQTVYRIFQNIDKTQMNSFWLGLCSIVFLQSLRVIKRRCFPNPVLSGLFKKENADAEKPLDNVHEIRTPVRDPSVAPPDLTYSHGFSLTEQQYISMEQERNARNHTEGDDVPTTPKSKLALLGIFLARTMCDLGPLIVCVAGGLVGYAVGPKKLKLTGTIPSGFPAPLEPWYGFNNGLIDGDKFGGMLGHAATIAVVVYLSSIAMAKRLAIMRGEDIKTDQELMGLGVASIVCGFFRAMPPTGGMSRTAVNLQNAHTQLASIITCLIIIFSLYVLTGAMYYLPKATLASIIIVAGWSLVEFKEAKWLYRVRRDEFYVWVASFVLTCGLGVLDGLIASIVCSVLALMYKTKTSPVAILGELDNGALVDRDIHLDAKHLDDVVAVRVEATLCFANCERLADIIDTEIQNMKSLDVTIRGVVLDAQRMNDLDATTIQLLSDVQEKLNVRKIQFAIANASSKLYDLLAATNLLKRLVGQNPSMKLDNAVHILRNLPLSSGATSPASNQGTSV